MADEEFRALLPFLGDLETVLPKGLWYIEEGTSFSVTPNVVEFSVWQSRQPSRRMVISAS